MAVVFCISSKRLVGYLATELQDKAQRHRVRDKVMLVTSSQILSTNDAQKITELAA